jgi:ABC-2 type transport system ATP-binding protein
MLALTGIQKSFGETPVLNIKRLQLDSGVYWLRGSNGAGKSTLLKILAGLIPFKGEVSLEGGISLRAQPVAYRCNVNFAEAEPVYPSFLTGDELVAFVRGIRKGTAGQVTELKKLLRAEGYFGNPTGSYSSGMLKKLSLVLAFLGAPKWVLLDEPLTTLDLEAQEALCRLVMREHREKGISFLLTSHHSIENDLLQFDKVFTIKNAALVETTRNV